MIAKLISIKYPKAGTVFKPEQSSEPVIINNIDDIKSSIHQQLFSGNNDYVLINYNNSLYICEKLEDGKYTKRLISYHPLQDLVNL